MDTRLSTAGAYSHALQNNAKGAMRELAHRFITGLGEFGMPKADEKLDSTNLKTEEMEKFGITRVPVDYFHLGSYRHTSLDAAVGEAKRDFLENPKLASGTGQT